MQYLMPVVLIAAVAVSAQPASAAQRVGAVHYIVTSVADSPDGRLASEELLSVYTTGGGVVVKVQNRAGDAVATAATFDRNGLLEIDTADPAVVCYNVAMKLLADAAAQNAMSPVSVGFAGGIVTVPMQLTSAPQADGTQSVTARGSRETTLSDGRAGTRLTFVATGNVTAKRSSLLEARFDEASVLTTTGTAVARTTCTVARVSDRLPSPTPETI
jgi:hypothetical protein